MFQINHTKRPRGLSARVIAAVAIVALLALGVSAGPVSARDDDHRGDRRGGGEHHHGWTGGYYRAPPVIYGGPYGSPYGGGYGYYPPPVVYGPSVGITLPGLSIGIR